MDGTTSTHRSILDLKPKPARLILHTTVMGDRNVWVARWFLPGGIEPRFIILGRTRARAEQLAREQILLHGYHTFNLKVEEA